jgi:hypothetical protein
VSYEIERIESDVVNLGTPLKRADDPSNLRCSNIKKEFQPLNKYFSKRDKYLIMRACVRKYGTSDMESNFYRSICFEIN